MKIIRFLVAFVVTVGLVVVLDHRFGKIPPLGKLFSPFMGVWQNSPTMRSIHHSNFSATQKEVSVYWDQRHVPHIVGEKLNDVYFAQGYVTATDRLWQMDFISRVASGRISEVVGSIAIDFDRSQRQIGMVYASEKALEELQKNSISSEAVRAYCKGVNAYIAKLQPKDYPIEYKILDYSPEEWTPLKMCLVSKYIAWMLTGSGFDLYMTRLLKEYGKSAIEELFPHRIGNEHTVIPSEKKWDFTGDASLTPPKELYIPKNLGNPILGMVPFGHGSNNWAVSGEKTASGYPLLANDPHLELTFPSIWYETHLITPETNVYGVTVPGALGIVIGFNEKIAWGVTNAYMDVSDWYEIEFKDETCSEYRYNGTWKTTQKRIETIYVRNEQPSIETIVYTHYGPVPISISTNKPSKFPIYSALRWTGHDPSNEILAIIRLNHAKNYADFVSALKDFQCPGQNFVFAGQENTIAMWHNGKFPIKWPEQGRTICDGSDPKYEWQGWIPHEQLPHIENPSNHILHSANQTATDTKYPYYMTGPFERFRNVRIAECLEKLNQITPGDFQKLQVDTKSILAEQVLPIFLRSLRTNELTEDQLKIVECMKNWNYHYDPALIPPSIFTEWWRKLEKATFEDELGQDRYYFMYPFWGQTAYLLTEKPGSRWFDNTKTPELETASHLIHQTFIQTCTSLIQKFGKMGSHWEWGKYKATKIPHLAKIPGLGKDFVNVGGGRHIVCANFKELGTSWRMIVSLEPQVRAWGIYPGGQSGDPCSQHYDDFFEAWQKGEVHSLLYLNETELQHSDKIVSKWKIQ